MNLTKGLPTPAVENALQCIDDDRALDKALESHMIIVNRRYLGSEALHLCPNNIIKQ